MPPSENVKEREYIYRTAECAIFIRVKAYLNIQYIIQMLDIFASTSRSEMRFIIIKGAKI
jgi:hypothetical protein